MARLDFFRRGESAAPPFHRRPADDFVIAPDFVVFMFAAVLAIVSAIIMIALGVDGAVIRITPAGTFAPM